MPKATRKKSKGEETRRGTVQKSKRSKTGRTTTTTTTRLLDHGGASASVKATSNSDSDSDGLEVLDLSKQCEVDEQLELSASKSNLSAFNVKSILHHVLSDERVIAMACKAADEEGDDRNEPALLDIEPKLTRSRFREVAQTTGATNPLELVKDAIIHSPLKDIVSPRKRKLKSPVKENRSEAVKVPLSEIKFSDGGSSDEEYVPATDEWEESEEDSESNLSNASDLASPEPLRRTSRVKRNILCEPVTSPPRPAKRDKRGDVNNSAGAESVVSPFKVPFPVSKNTRQQKEKEKEDLIASRTRSRLPLTDTCLEDLEADFLVPDCTPDMFDVINLDELDSDDIFWRQWLSTLTSEKANDVEDVEDTEYNFMAEEETEEKEEYRNDRAVQVSQKELTELFEELLNEFDEETNEPESDRHEKLGAEVENAVTEEPDMTYEQTIRLTRQLQQHTQLLVQVHLLAREDNCFKEQSTTCAKSLQELVDLSKSNVAKLLQNGQSRPSVFACVGLADALRLIGEPLRISPIPSTTQDQLASVAQTPPIQGWNSSNDRRAVVPRPIANILHVAPIFIYTGLLPLCEFRSYLTSQHTKFLQAEDNLLVLGLDQFGPNWALIQKHYLPSKTAKQIKIRRKNLCSKRSADNVMKQFRKTGVIPNLPVSVNLKASEDRTRAILPNKEVVVETKAEELKVNGGRKKKLVKQDEPCGSVPPVLQVKPEVKGVVVINEDNITSGPLCSETIIDVDNTETVATRLDESEHDVKQCESVARDTEKVDNDERGLSTSAAVQDDPLSVSSVTSLDGPCDDIIDKEQDVEKEDPDDEVKENVANTEDDASDNAKTRDRAVAFAQFYMNNVKKCLKDDNSTYNTFLDALLKSKFECWSPAKLYWKVSTVLHNFPELVRDFVGFLEPHQAVEVGAFMTSNEVLRARTFLKRLESHFQKNPTHFQKIIKAFTTYNFKDPRPTDLYDAIIPLLRGQQHLVEEFNSFFGHLQPRLSDSDDFEEVELGSGSDGEVDDFEEIIIPDLTSRSTKRSVLKGRGMFTKLAAKPGQKKPYCTTTVRKGSKLKRADMKNSMADPSLKPDHVDESREPSNEDLNEDGDDSKDNDEHGFTVDDKEQLDSDGEFSGYKDGELSQTDTELKKYHSDHSDVSSVASETGDDFLDINSPGTTQGSHMTSSCESISDLSNDGCDLATTPSKDVFDVARQHDDVGSGDMENDSRDVALDDDRSEDLEHFIENCSEQAEEVYCNEEDDERRSQEELQRISANNLELCEDGKSLIVWTRDEDKKILQLYQNEGFSENIFDNIARELGNRTAFQVKGRFRVLVGLLSTNDESSSEESGSEFDSIDDVDEKI